MAGTLTAGGVGSRDGPLQFPVVADFECVHLRFRAARSELSDLCFQAASNSGGVFRLNLPTGAGKTLSGLRYALRHAEKFGKERIFFISPLLSILEQNALEMRKAIGDDSLVLEHHSDIITNELTDDELNRYELLCEFMEQPDRHNDSRINFLIHFSVGKPPP